MSTHKLEDFKVGMKVSYTINPALRGVYYEELTKNTGVITYIIPEKGVPWPIAVTGFEDKKGTDFNDALCHPSELEIIPE